MSTKFSELEQKCKKSVEHFKKEVSKMRGGRATTSMLEGIMVECYGSMVPLIQVGLISAPEPRLLTVQVYDPSSVESVEKAFLQSDLGLNPQRDGSLIRLNIPAMTKERREELCKAVRERAEKERVTLRGIRREAIEGLKKGGASEDECRRGEKEIQQIIDQSVTLVDQIAKQKEEDILKS